MRPLCAVVLGSLVSAVALIGAAIGRYPGGTWLTPSADRHHFWFNFLCDLLRAQGLNGRPNPTGSKLATVGMLAMVVTLAAYWLLAPRLMPGRPMLGVLVLVAGELSAVGLIAVALLPSDRFGSWHTVAIFLAVVPGVIGVSCAVMGVGFEPGAARWALPLGLLMWGSFLATAVLFVLHLRAGGTGYLRVLPTMQRVASLVAVAWIMSTTLQLWARGRPGG